MNHLNPCAQNREPGFAVKPEENRRRAKKRLPM
jgi:hypothetical protein